MTAKRSRYQGASGIVFSKDKHAKPYKEMYWKLPRIKRLRFNEKGIFAVLQLSKEGDHKGNICAITPPGTRAFLEDRLRQLIRETKHEGFTKAAQRFRVAVKRWREERPGFYLTSDILVMGKISAPIAKFVHPRWKPPALKAPPAPAQCYVPDVGEVDLLFIPPFLDRKAEVPLNHPLRRRTKAHAKAAE